MKYALVLIATGMLLAGCDRPEAPEQMHAFDAEMDAVQPGPWVIVDPGLENPQRVERPMPEPTPAVAETAQPQPQPAMPSAENVPALPAPAPAAPAPAPAPAPPTYQPAPTGPSPDMGW